VNRNCYRLSRVSWALLKFLVFYVRNGVYSSSDSTFFIDSGVKPSAKKHACKCFRLTDKW